MWFMPIRTVPDKVFDLSRVPSTSGQREALRARSMDLVAIGEGRDLMFILGIIPPTKLSLTAYFWLLYVQGTRPTLGQLRGMRKVFAGWRKMLSYEILLAEVRNKQAKRFAEFFGGVETAPGLMEWV